MILLLQEFNKSLELFKISVTFKYVLTSNEDIFGNTGNVHSDKRNLKNNNNNKKPIIWTISSYQLTNHMCVLQIQDSQLSYLFS